MGCTMATISEYAVMADAVYDDDPSVDDAIETYRQCSPLRGFYGQHLLTLRLVVHSAD